MFLLFKASYTINSLLVSSLSHVYSILLFNTFSLCFRFGFLLVFILLDFYFQEDSTLHFCSGVEIGIIVVSAPFLGDAFLPLFSVNYY